MSIERSVSDHYSHGRLGEEILDILAEHLDDPERVEPSDLSAIDEFHIGGIEATREFTGRLGLDASMRVLDVGCGIGGSARHVAATHGCHVAGLDLTPEYCEVAEMLTAKVGLGDRVEFHEGSALDMPFEDRSFDSAFTIHAAMNIADKRALYREVRRVVKPGSVFGIYDVLRGPKSGDLAYPVPWSATVATSFLASNEELQRMLDDTGFQVEAMLDRTGMALEFFEKQRRVRAKGGASPRGLHVVMGNDFEEKIGNLVRNIELELCGPWELVCRRR